MGLTPGELFIIGMLFIVLGERALDRGQLWLAGAGLVGVVLSFGAALYGWFGP